MKTRRLQLMLRIGNEETYEVVEMKKRMVKQKKVSLKRWKSVIAKH